VSRVRWLSRAASAALVCGLVGLTWLVSSLAWAAAGEVLRAGRRGGAPAFDDLVVCCALLVLAATLAWLGLGVLLTLGTYTLRCTHTAAGRLARRLTPSLVRRLVAGACGAAVLAPPGVLTPPATAGAAYHAHILPAGHGGGASSARPGTLPVPDRPAAGLARVRNHGLAHRHAWVRVRPGDTLWAIAGRRLPPAASDADVAAAWPRWFRRNRGLVGPDPDLIHPGTRLRVPPRPH